MPSINYRGYFFILLLQIHFKLINNLYFSDNYDDFLVREMHFFL